MFVICKPGCPVARDERERPLYVTRACSWGIDPATAMRFETHRKARSWIDTSFTQLAVGASVIPAKYIVEVP